MGKRHKKTIRNKKNDDINDKALMFLVLMLYLGQLFFFKLAGPIAGTILAYIIFLLGIFVTNDFRAGFIALPTLGFFQWMIILGHAIHVCTPLEGVILVLYPLYLIFTMFILAHWGESKDILIILPMRFSFVRKRAKRYPGGYEETKKMFEMTTRMLRGDDITKESLLQQFYSVKQALQSDNWRKSSDNNKDIIDYFWYFIANTGRDLLKELDLIKKLIEASEKSLKVKKIERKPANPTEKEVKNGEFSSDDMNGYLEFFAKTHPEDFKAEKASLTQDISDYKNTD